MAVRVKLFATTLRVEQQIHKTSAPGPAGFARKVRLPRRSLAQRRKGAKRYRVSKGFSLRLCAFAREIFSSFRGPWMHLSTFRAKRLRVSPGIKRGFAQKVILLVWCGYAAPHIR